MFNFVFQPAVFNALPGAGSVLGAVCVKIEQGVSE